MADRFWSFFLWSFALSNVIKYIENQEEHHKIRTFKEEYIEFLKLFDIDFKDEYIFAEV